MTKLILVLLLLMANSFRFSVSPQVCIHPCHIKVTYKAPADAHTLRLELEDRDGVKLISEEAVTDYTKDRFYILYEEGSYTVTFSVDGLYVDRTTVEVR